MNQTSHSVKAVFWAMKIRLDIESSALYLVYVHFDVDYPAEKIGVSLLIMNYTTFSAIVSECKYLSFGLVVGVVAGMDQHIWVLWVGLTTYIVTRLIQVILNFRQGRVGCWAAKATQ